jgi:hypothetical protein
MYSTGVYKSTNAGASWAAVNSGLDLWMKAICVDPANSSIVYAGSNWSGTNGKVFKSTNGGANWVGTWPSGAAVTAVAVDPHNSSRVIAGTDPAGACVSVDGGATWAHDTDPGVPAVYAVAIDPVTSTVYAGSSDGVMKITVVKSGF